jgi:putative membrane protein
MPSDRRLHPASVLFTLGGQVREFAVPILIVLFGAGSAGMDWQAWTLVLIVPYTALAILRYASFRYRYDESEMVIRTGFVFRNERHVPYARIQNIDAVQNVVHRLLGVVDVRLQTGGGNEPEAKLAVLPMAALEEMRARVFAGRGTSPGEPAEPVESAEPEEVLLVLPRRALALYGFIENRGFVIIAAAFGLLWELGPMDRLFNRAFGQGSAGRGVLRDLARSIFGSGGFPLGRIALMALAFVVVLLLIRLLSMAWAVVRLYGFRLTRAGDDLRTEFGLLTRVAATIPVRRIQTLTIREGLLQRLFRRAAVRVDTAGGEGGRRGAREREWLAPIVARDDVPRLVSSVLPEVDPAAVVWQPVAPRASRRILIEWLIVVGVITVPLVVVFRWWDLAIVAALVAWAIFASKRQARHLGWAITDDAVFYRSGWIWRQTTVARFSKIQVVSFRESPFDRRAAMARVHVDTAGAGDLSHRVNVPYLPRATAVELWTTLAAQAGRTAFRW